MNSIAILSLLLILIIMVGLTTLLIVCHRADTDLILAQTDLIQEQEQYIQTLESHNKELLELLGAPTIPDHDKETK